MPAISKKKQSDKGSLKAVKRAPAPKAAEKRPNAASVVAKPPIGHNSGKVNKPLIDIFKKHAEYEENKRQLSKAQRDLRAKAKEEHGIPTANFQHEVKMQKLDQDVRVQFETTATDLKGMLGYQFALNLASTDEGESDESEKEEGDDVKKEPEAKDDHEEGDEEEKEPKSATPSFLRRAAASDATH